jgi:hypothetical protein
MDMRVPFQVSAKGMHGRNNARFKAFRLAKAGKPREHSIGAGSKKYMKQFSILLEKDSQLLGDSEDNMSMCTIDKLGRDRISTVLSILGTTRSTETAFAGEENMLNLTAMLAKIDGMTHRRFATH